MVKKCEYIYWQNSFQFSYCWLKQIFIVFTKYSAKVVFNRNILMMNSNKNHIKFKIESILNIFLNYDVFLSMSLVPVNRLSKLCNFLQNDAPIIFKET
jgi:hypothetical protein